MTIKGWKHAGRDLTKWRRDANNASRVKLVTLKKDGTESKMHDAASHHDSVEKAIEHHKYLHKVNPGKTYSHHVYDHENKLLGKVSGPEADMHEPDSQHSEESLGTIHSKYLPNDHTHQRFAKTLKDHGGSFTNNSPHSDGGRVHSFSVPKASKKKFKDAAKTQGFSYHYSMDGESGDSQHSQHSEQPVIASTPPLLLGGLGPSVQFREEPVQQFSEGIKWQPEWFGESGRHSAGHGFSVHKPQESGPNAGKGWSLHHYSDNTNNSKTKFVGHYKTKDEAKKAAESHSSQHSEEPVAEQFGEKRSDVLGHLKDHYHQEEYEHQPGAHVYWMKHKGSGHSVDDLQSHLKSKGIKTKKIEGTSYSPPSLIGQHGKHGFSISHTGKTIHVRFHKTHGDSIGREGD